MSSENNISIIGAGPVGSLLALNLARKGNRVDVYERRGDMRLNNADRGRSINLALSDRGLKALHEVGLENEVRQMAIPMHGRMVHTLDGSINFQPYGLEGQYINSISRGGLNQLLMTKAEAQGNVSIHFNQRCLDVDLPNGKLLMEDTMSQQQHTINPSVTFGTDGAFSAIRSAMTKTDRFNYSQQYLPHGYKELTIPAATNGGFAMEKNALHIWPRKSFMLIALPNLNGSFTCTLFLALEGEVSFAQLTNHITARAFFEQHFSDALALMPDFENDFFGNPTSSLVTIKCYPWRYGSQFMLLGDAAHAVVPFYGQGMNAGFEDCTVLNELMDIYNDNWQTILPAFEQKRKPDADTIAELAVRNFIEMRDSVADERYLLRRQLEKALQLRHPNDFLPLYSMVTFSHLSYSKALANGLAHDAFFANKTLDELKHAVGLLGTVEGDKLLDSWLTFLRVQ